LKAVYDVIVSSAETIGAFNTGFDTIDLHRPSSAETGAFNMGFDADSLHRPTLKAKFDSASSYVRFKR
jgi:hypothetical protein